MKFYSLYRLPPSRHYAVPWHRTLRCTSQPAKCYYSVPMLVTSHHYSFKVLSRKHSASMWRSKQDCYTHHTLVCLLAHLVFSFLVTPYKRAASCFMFYPSRYVSTIYISVTNNTRGLFWIIIIHYITNVFFEPCLISFNCLPYVNSAITHTSKLTNG